LCRKCKAVSTIQGPLTQLMVSTLGAGVSLGPA
jgi:hypothetical protein